MTARWRLNLVVLAMLLLLSSLVTRVVYLQVVEREFLIEQGKMRSAREVEVGAHRGMITDRHGNPLAVSTPVTSLWGDPRRLRADDLPRIAAATGVSLQTLQRRYDIHRAFFYVQRHMNPADAEAVLALRIPGLYGRQEYKRYYPAGEVAAHIVGFTDIDDHGQEGIELAYDELLSGRPGRDLVLQSLNGQVVRHVESRHLPQPGRDLQLTLDLDLQYQTYRSLKAAFQRHQADWASVVVLDPRTGEVLAMANQPSYNPNDRASIQSAHLRNRAITDAFEPGSVIKTMTVAAALSSGQFQPDQLIDTNPGRLSIGGGSTVRDFRNYGVLDVTEIMAKSSNIGVSKMAMELGGQSLWSTFYQFGLGQSVGVGFPGEANGTLPNRARWSTAQVATLSYGYGMTATTLQLAQAYAAIVNDGVRVQPQILRNVLVANPVRVMTPQVARELRDMLEAVTADGGTGTRARTPFYSVAGKTGTAHTVGLAGYDDNSYRSVFVGYAPIHDPQVVVAVVVNNPRGEEYFGGAVAAPLFAEITQQTLTHFGVAPDSIMTALEGR
ncbi:penicillin-binding protein 2 [Salinispirillum sp. LH 10-3-1]|uniref:Peptidoglycan D,D-transpeptidase FtsI n=1 Tax=Salinispirillum sp. LH 10-3-1 TaxID=2952525 RepID=A0AB38YI40_9GAMM